MKGIGRGVVFLGCLCLGSILSATAYGDGLIRDGIGAISIGRGGTNIAHSDNGAVILDNPAGIVNFERRGYAEVGIDTLITDIDYSDPQNNTHASTQPMPIPELALYWTSEDKSWGAGIGFFAPAGFSASYMMDPNSPVFGPGKSRYRSLGSYIKILPGMAFHVTDNLAVGAAIGMGINRMELDGPFYMQSGALAGIPANFDLTTTGAALIWNIGLQYKVSDQTTIGLAYNSDASFTGKGDLHATVYGLAPVGIPSDFNARLAVTWPASLGLGIKHVMAERHRFSTDVIWYNWGNAFDDFGLRLSHPSNPLFAPVVGKALNQYIPLNWSDSVSVRLGYEFFATDVDTWRLGYVYHPSPVPNNTLNPYLDGVLEHAFSFGYSRRWNNWLFNMAYQYSFSPKREVQDSIIVGNDFADSTFRAQAHWISLSISKYF